MIPTIDDKVIRLLAERHLNKTPVRDWAVLCLEQGFDSRNLRILASMIDRESAVLFDTKLKLALDELGWSEIPFEPLMLMYARMLARDVLDRKADPIEASRELYKILNSAELHRELAAWYDIDEMIWSQSYYEKTGDRSDYFYREPNELNDIILKACADFLISTNNSLSSLADTSFEEAEASLRRFLKDNNYPDSVKWVFVEDLIYAQMDLLIRTPLPTDNRDRARLCFDLGRDRNLGVTLHALCSVGNDTFCYIALPQDAIDAQYRLMGNQHLKLQIRESALRPQLSSGLLWTVRRRLTKWPTRVYWENQIPSRNTLLAKSTEDS